MTLFEVIHWNTGPDIFSIGNFTLRWYPLMFVIGFIVGLQIMTWVYKREGKDVEELDTLLIVMILGSIVGARLGHYLFYDPQIIFSNPLEVFLPIELEPSTIFGIKLPFRFVGFRGLASHGAVLSLLILLFWYSQKYKHNFMWLVDRISITVAFTAIFIRIGNFFNHEIVGSVADPDKIPWAVSFKYHSDQLPRHPAQLYESFLYLITFITLLTMYRKKGKYTPYGLLFGTFMVMVWTARFIIEFFKAEQNENDLYVLKTVGLNIGQILSLPLIITGLIVLFYYVPKFGKPQMLADNKE